MKPTTKKALELVSRPSGACVTSFLDAGVGVRYSARIHELREMGYRIVTRPRCNLHSHPKATPSYHMSPDRSELMDVLDGAMSAYRLGVDDER